MARRGTKKKREPVGDPSDPHGMAAWLAHYLEWLRSHNYSDSTVDNRESYLSLFCAWCEERGITRPSEVTKPILERYQRHLYHYRKPHNGQPLSFRSQYSRLVRDSVEWSGVFSSKLYPRNLLSDNESATRHAIARSESSPSK